MMLNVSRIKTLFATLFILSLNTVFASKITISSDCELTTNLNINGITIKRLLIDTGSSGGLNLSEKVIQTLPGTPARFLKTKKYTDAYGGIRQTNIYEVPELMIDGIRQQKVRLIAFKPWGKMDEHQKAFPINGVIGLDTFGDKVLHIDLQKMNLSISDSFIPEQTALWEKLSINRTDYGAEINAIGEGGRPLRLVIDTGANRSVIFNKNTDVESAEVTEVVAGKNLVIPALKMTMNAPALADIDGFVGCDFIKNKHLVIAKDHLYISVN